MVTSVLSVLFISLVIVEDIFFYVQAFLTKDYVLLGVLNIINLILGTLIGLLLLAVTVVEINRNLKRKTIRVLKEDLNYLGYVFEEDNWQREIPVLRNRREYELKPVNRLKAWCYYRSDITYLFRKTVDTSSFKFTTPKKNGSRPNLFFDLNLQHSIGKEVSLALRTEKKLLKGKNLDAATPLASFTFVGETDLERVNFFQKNDYVLSEIVKLGETPLEQLAPFDGVPPSMVMKVFGKAS